MPVGVVRFSPGEMDKVAVDRASDRVRVFDVSDGLQGDLHWLSRPAAVRPATAGCGSRRGRRCDHRSAEFAARAGGRRRRASSWRRPTAARFADRASGAAAHVDAPHRLRGPEPVGRVEAEVSLLALRAQQRVGGGGHAPGGVFTNLPPGHYRFRVSATNDGLWTDAAIWEFSVAPPFFRTTWFIGFCAMGCRAAAGPVVVAETAGSAGTVRIGVRGAHAREPRHPRHAAAEPRRDRSRARGHCQPVGEIAGSASESLRRLRRQVTHSVREAREWIGNCVEPDGAAGARGDC